LKERLPVVTIDPVRIPLGPPPFRGDSVKPPAILIDDPDANEHYDLRGTLAGWAPGLIAVVEPLAAASGADAGPESGAPAAPAGKSDSDTTRALKSARVRYRMEAKATAAREFDVAEGPVVLRALASPLLIVAFVSPRTFPLLVALGQHQASRAWLRVGITGVAMDHPYNLARKLIMEGAIAYHEHTRTLEKVLCRRLQLMVASHAERQHTS